MLCLPAALLNGLAAGPALAGRPAFFYAAEAAGAAAAGALTVFHSYLLPSWDPAKVLALACIELVDLFLLATVFYIALGLWELFIDDRAPVPHWLEIHTLDDLKTKLAGTVAAVLGVTFLGQVVTWDGERDLLGYGLATAAVIAALTWFISGKPDKPSPPGGKD